ncbi:MAG TPA: M24 family metallopeptidase [Gemmatimonadaceae bacterium]|jgi:Xaa-Pro aminopeptidase
MLQPQSLPSLHAVFPELAEPVDGWLLFDFRGINPIMATVVGREVVGSRRAYVYIPRSSAPVALVHAVDAELWRDWPAEWRRIVWVQREELSSALASLVGGRTIAIEYSPNGAIPYADYVPAGTVELLRASGARPVSSAELVTRYCSVWSDAELASHLRAAEVVADIAREGLRIAGERSRTEAPATEHEITRFVLDAFDRAGLVTNSDPCVSFGANAARTHYLATAESSATIVPGQLVLLDLWAKEPGGIYADQTWMGAIGAPSDRAVELWSIVREARDAALDHLREHLSAGLETLGGDADSAARGVIERYGYADRIVCRTGHSIDRVGLHGLGPTLDDIESYDARRIIPGVGFSVEPGIYIPGEIGVRSEVNGHARAGGLDVTPGEYQRDLLVV